MIIPNQQSYFTILPENKNYYDSIFSYYHSYFYSTISIKHQEYCQLSCSKIDIEHQRKINTSLQNILLFLSE